MINKWKAKIVKRWLYNRRNPPWREDPRIKRENTVVISRTPVTILIQYLLEQTFSDCAENKLSLINSVHLCLIVMNIILTVIHALKPSSLTHFLQIYCTRLTGPRSHTPWAWTAKRVLTIYIYIYIYIWVRLMSRALVHWGHIDCDTCSFLDTCHNCNASSEWT